jgi:hypothetical protein
VAKAAPPAPARAAPPAEKAPEPAAKPVKPAAPAAVATPVPLPPPPAAPTAPPAAAKPPPAQPPAQPPTAAPEAAPKLPASKALSPVAVQRAIGRQKAAFDKCVETALAAPGSEALKGRKIGLIILVDSGGLVEASEVEEADVEGAPLGACLRRVASRLLFPPFEGESVGMRVPLVLAAPGR